MTFGVPWNVKGIRPETRLTAKEAARRSGLSVGEWLNSVIVESAIEEGVRPRRRASLDDDDDGSAEDDTLAGVNQRLDGLTRQLDRLSRVDIKRHGA